MLFKLPIPLLKQGLHLQRYCTVTKASSAMTGLQLNEVLSALEKFAPKLLSESWDNTGLLVEPYTPREIHKVMLTNDLTEEVALEADNLGCEMIISYHPPIFAPLKSVKQSAWKERIVSLLLEKQIFLYSPHTSWDAVKGGVNDWLGSAFPVVESNPITPGVDPKTGCGRLLRLEKNISISDAVLCVKKLTGLQYVRLALGKNKAINENCLETIALCAGSGASVLKNVPADLYLTGEMLHHDVLDAAQKGISVILTNHSDSERGFLKVFSAYLQNDLNDRVKVLVSACDKDPLTTV